MSHENSQTETTRQALREQREKLLQRIHALLERDSRVVAAWLFGSLGRQNEDDLSDLDIWIVVSDESLRAVRAQRRAFVTPFSALLALEEMPHNAPLGGAYLLTVYDGPTAPQLVDWYWQPQSRAQIPTDARLLFDRAGLPYADGPTTFQNMPLEARQEDTADEPTLTEAGQRAEQSRNLLSFFWAMLLISAKYVTRQRSDEEPMMLGMLLDMLRETRAFAGLEPTEAIIGNSPIPTQPLEKLNLLRRLAGEMESLLPSVQARGGFTPMAILEPTYRYLDTIERLVQAKPAGGL